MYQNTFHNNLDIVYLYIDLKTADKAVFKLLIHVNFNIYIDNYFLSVRMVSCVPKKTIRMKGVKENS